MQKLMNKPWKIVLAILLTFGFVTAGATQTTYPSGTPCAESISEADEATAEAEAHSEEGESESKTYMDEAQTYRDEAQNEYDEGNCT